MANSNNFNFDKYNKLMKGVGIGLKLHLGAQLLKDAVDGLEYFANPIAPEGRAALSEVQTFHVLYKESAKKAVAERENKSGSKEIDNSTVPQVGIADMIAQMGELTRQLAFLKAGNLAGAASAERSIEEIGDGALHAAGDPQQQAA